MPRKPKAEPDFELDAADAPDWEPTQGWIPDEVTA